MFAGSTWAACSSPEGSAGDIRYASNLSTFVFCNDENWVSMAGWNNSSGGGASLLNELTDVDTTGAASGYALTYNGSAWVPAVIDDPRIGTLTNTKWCTTDGTSINCATDAPLTSTSVLNDLSDVDTTGAATGKILAYDGANWVVSDTTSGADNLGDHVATQALIMGAYNISSTGYVSASAIYSNDANAYFYNNFTIPSLVFDTDDYIRYTRATNMFDVLIGGSSYARVTSAGISTTTLTADVVTATTLNGQYASFTTVQAGGLTASGIVTASYFEGDGSRLTNLPAGTATAASSTGAIQFNVANTMAGDGANLFWDDANNRLGVGKATPGYLMSVGDGSGTDYLFAQTSAGTADLGGILLSNNTGTGGSENTFKITSTYNGTTSGRARLGFVDNDNMETYLNSGAGLEFQYDGDVVLAQGAGNVGIGTTAPRATLQVSGSFTVSTTGQSTTPTLYVDTTGKVGIGTSAPLFSLSVVSNTNSPAVVWLSNDTDGASARSIFFLAGDGGGANSAGMQYANTSYSAGATSNLRANALSFYTNSGASGGMSFISTNASAPITFNTAGFNTTNERMRIDSAGNVGIGTATPGTKLEVAGHARLSGATSNTLSWGTTGVAAPAAGSAGMKLQLYGATGNTMATGDYALGVESSSMWFNSGSAYKWYSAGTSRMTLDASGNLTAVAFLYSSDRRLKENITPLGAGLAKLDAIKPVSFTYISDTTHRIHLGVIAQDVEKAYPEAVITDDKGMKRVDYPALVAPLISAVKELKTENETLRARVEALETATKVTTP